MNENIKLIGLDLDGTFLKDDKTLCDGAVQTVKRAAEKGIYTVPITGRPLSGIPQCIKDIDEIRYIICSNGSEIIDFKSGKSIYSSTLDNETVNKIISVLNESDCLYEVFADGYGYIDKTVYEFYKETYTGTVIGEYIFSSRKECDSTTKLFASGDKTADEVFIICKNDKHRQEIKAKFENFGNVQFCLLADKYLEITKKGTDKGAALKKICSHLNIDTAQTIAFGDGENDLQFLDVAGTAVAMENAVDAVKQKADFITKTNNENGVCIVLNDLLSRI